MSDAVRSLALAQEAHTVRYTCPECSAERKKKYDTCLSLTVEGTLAKWQCQHCGFSGAMRLNERRPFLQALPKPILISPPKEDELEAAYNWLSSRGITRDIASQLGVIGGIQFIDGEHRAVVGFPYFKDAKTYAVKWRALATKGFTQTGACKTLWGSEHIEKGHPLTIVEGECDALALFQAGVEAVSVPNGAPSRVKPPDDPKVRRNNDTKYDYLWAAKDFIEAAPKIIIAVDSDQPGDALGEEIARRVGRAKCWRALWPDGCKDANDVLRFHGPDVLRECIDNAQPWPVKGLYDASYFFDKVEALYEKGFPKGESTGFKCIDELYTVVPGQLTVATGSPGSGKSTFIDNLLVNMAKKSGHRFAVCSFENPPEVHIAKLASIVARQPFFDGPTPRMDRARRDAALQWIKEHFVFLHQTDGTLSSIDDIIDLTRSAVLRYGVRGLVIDPYNFIDRGVGTNETEWVSDALTKLKVLSMAHDLHTWVVAHPTKMHRRDDGSFPVPGGYDISGSAHWFNKADMGLTVHRPSLEDNQTEVHMWKVRFSFTGKIGSATMSYDISTGLYWEPVTE